MATRDRHKGFVLGVSLLGAFLFIGILTQGAFGWTPAKNLTAFTCVKGAESLDFSDAHCDKAVSPGTGTYGHIPIKVGETTSAETINTTPVVIKTTILGAPIELECGEARGTGTFKNEEPEPKVHTGSAEGNTHFSKCKFVTPAGCEVKGGTITLATLVGQPLEQGEKMGAEIKPKVGSTFTTVQVIHCAIEGTYVITGSFVAVGGAGATAKSTGSTAVYLPENESLFLGKTPVTFTVTTTVKTPGEIALSGTTVT